METKPNSIVIGLSPRCCVQAIDGTNMIILRKTKPKIEPPFVCYLYCNLDYNDSFPSHNMWIKDKTGFNHIGNGKVIGEFICDKIYNCDADSVGLFDRDTKEYLPECNISYREVIEQVGTMPPIYGWHISELTLYEIPKTIKPLPRRWNFASKNKIGDSEENV